LPTPTSRCLGKWSQLKGAREKVEASTEIKTAAEKAVELAPNDGLAWHLVGRWHQALAGLSGFTRGLAKLLYGGLPPASFDEAIKCFQKALELEPNRLMHSIEIGRTYAMMGMTAEARRYIEEGLAMPDREFDDPETKDRGRQALADLDESGALSNRG
jgi:tetratricopeptide (TPR) repeat protein